MEQNQMYFDTDDFEDALDAAVRALGGPKKVGPRLWPSLTVTDAGRRMSHCLLSGRSEKLALGELLLVMRWAKDEAKCHDPMNFLSAFLGYKSPEPKDPETENARLLRELNQNMERMQKQMTELRLNSNKLRSVS